MPRYMEASSIEEAYYLINAFLPEPETKQFLPNMTRSYVYEYPCQLGNDTSESEKITLQKGGNNGAKRLNCTLRRILRKEMKETIFHVIQLGSREDTLTCTKMDHRRLSQLPLFYLS